VLAGQVGDSSVRRTRRFNRGFVGDNFFKLFGRCEELLCFYDLFELIAGSNLCELDCFL
jgi:hypothetical protein